MSGLRINKDKTQAMIFGHNSENAIPTVETMGFEWVISGLGEKCTRWRRQTHILIDGHGDSMTESAQWGRFSSRENDRPSPSHVHSRLSGALHHLVGDY